MSYIPFISTFSRPIKRRKSHPGCKIAVSSHAPVKSFPLHPFVRSSKIRCTVSPTLMYSLILQNETQTFVSRLIRAPARDFSPTTNGTTAKKAHRAKPKSTGSSPQEGIAGSSADETGQRHRVCFQIATVLPEIQMLPKGSFAVYFIAVTAAALWSQNDVPKVPISPLTTISAAKSCATAPLFAAVRISTDHRQTKTFCRLFAALCKSF